MVSTRKMDSAPLSQANQKFVTPIKPRKKKSKKTKTIKTDYQNNMPKDLDRTAMGGDHESFDSNGPVEVIDMADLISAAEFDKNATIVNSEHNKDISTEIQPQEEITIPVEQKKTDEEKVEKPQDDDDANQESLSDAGAEDLEELRFAENMLGQAERIFDINDDLDELNRSKWSATPILSEAIAKLNFLKERLTKIKAHSLDLPEFLERRPMKDQPEYAYIKRVLQAWNEAREKVEAAKQIVYGLPIAPGMKSLELPKKAVSVSTASFAAELKTQNLRKEKQLQARFEKAQERLAEDTQFEHQKQVEEQQPNKVQSNMAEMYGNQRGQKLNQMLDQRTREFSKARNINSLPNRLARSDVGMCQDYFTDGSMDGDLQIKDCPERKIYNQEQPPIRILPRGVKLEDFVNPKIKVSRSAPGPNTEKRIQDTYSGTNAMPNDQYLQENNNYQGRHFADPLEFPTSQRQNWESPREAFPTRNERSHDFRGSRFREIPLPPENDWVSVATDRHPETNKPRLAYGKITQFKDLFTRSFQYHKLYNPNSMGNVNSATKSIQVTNFDGRNVEYFRQFEQAILLKVINNDTMDFQTKFHFLLAHTAGAALRTVQIYTNDLDMANFVQALEDLYYTYGQPHQLRDALLHQLSEEDPVDVKKPESLQKISALIKRIQKTFAQEGIPQNSDVLSNGLLLEIVKMTEESKRDYKQWIINGQREKGLASFTQWINYMYEYSVTDTIKHKHVRSIKSSKPPVLMEAAIIREEPIHDFNQEPPRDLQTNDQGSNELNEPIIIMANQANQMADRCELCYDFKHKFADCRIYMTFTPDQRKLALLRHGACYTCTEVGHTASKCTSRRSCQGCQSNRHHETICNASEDSWKAVLYKKWDKTKNSSFQFEPKNQTSTSQNTEVKSKTTANPSKPQDNKPKVSFLVEEGEEAI